MTLDKVIKDLKDMRNAGFIDCNIQCFLDQLEKVTEKVVVDKFIADWYEDHKDDLDYSIWNVITSKAILTRKEATIKDWIEDNEDAIITIVKMHLFGYTVKEVKRYIVRVKNTSKNSNCLNFYEYRNLWMFVDDKGVSDYRVKHTKEELENAGFSWVFNCPGIEVEEVEE